MPQGFDPQSFISRYQQLGDQARQANEKRYGQLLGIQDHRQKQFGDQLDATGEALQRRSRDVMGLLEGSGTSARRRVRQETASAKAGDTQSLIDRGLFNSTVLDATRRQRDRAAEDQQQSIDESVRTQQAGALERTQGDLSNFMFQRAQAQSGLLGERQGIIERRHDVPPDMGALIQMLMQYGAGKGQLAGISSGPTLHGTVGATSAGGGAFGAGGGTSSGGAGGGSMFGGGATGGSLSSGIATHTNPNPFDDPPIHQSGGGGSGGGGGGKTITVGAGIPLPPGKWKLVSSKGKGLSGSKTYRKA